MIGLLTTFIVEAKQLPKPIKSDTFETLNHHVAALAIGEKRITYLPPDGANAYDLGYKKTSKGLTFSGLLESRRSNLDPKKYKEASWSGAESVEGSTILIDGFRLGIVVLDKDLKFKRKSDVVYDLVKPAADRLGEAPEFEVQNLRKKFDLEMKTAPGNRLRGLALKSIGKEKVEFFLGMSLKSFPLGILECTKNKIHQCRISRICNFDGFRSIPPRSRRGVAYDRKNKKLYMLNETKNAVVVAKFNQCNDIRIIETLKFHSKMKPTKSIAFGVGRLWVGLQTRDDYYNTSVFSYKLD
jgi:hypothetical protein